MDPESQNWPCDTFISATEISKSYTFYFKSLITESVLLIWETDVFVLLQEQNRGLSSVWVLDSQVWRLKAENMLTH